MKSLTKSEITLEILKSFVYLEDFEISYASSPSGKPLGLSSFPHHIISQPKQFGARSPYLYEASLVPRHFKSGGGAPGYGASTELAERCSLNDTVSPFPHFLFLISYFFVPGFITTRLYTLMRRLELACACAFE